MPSSSSTSTEDQNLLIRTIETIIRYVIVIGGKVAREIDLIERFFIKLTNIYAFTSQMVFFVLCALTFKEITMQEDQNEKHVLIGLKSLLFYSVFTYFIAKSRDILTSNHQSRAAPFRSWNFFESLCKIAIEWAKAIVVIICLREQGIYFKPSPFYAATTFTYYLCTEKVFVEILLNVLAYFEMRLFDNMEYLYIPMILNLYTILMAFCMELYVLYTGEFLVFSMISTYMIIHLRLKDTYYNYWKLIKLEQQTFDNFRNATAKELEEYDDVCAVCLNKMSKAKITPCNHFFHAGCLKECLKSSFLCPICKLNFDSA